MELFHLCFSNALQVILALFLYKLSLDFDDTDKHFRKSLLHCSLYLYLRNWHSGTEVEWSEH